MPLTYSLLPTYHLCCNSPRCSLLCAIAGCLLILIAHPVVLRFLYGFFGVLLAVCCVQFGLERFGRILFYVLAKEWR